MRPAPPILAPRPKAPAPAPPSAPEVSPPAAEQATVYPWAYSPEALADPRRDVWVRHCDAQPLTGDEYDYVTGKPIPDYAQPCYPPK